MADKSPRLDLDRYEQGDTDWDHTDLVNAVDELAIDRGPIVDRPDTGDYDDQLYHAVDQEILWRWDADAADWKAVGGRGSSDQPLPGTVHRESVEADKTSITEEFDYTPIGDWAQQRTITDAVIEDTADQTGQFYPPYPIIDPTTDNYIVAGKSLGNIWVAEASSRSNLSASSNKTQVLDSANFSYSKFASPILQYYGDGGAAYRLYAGADGEIVYSEASSPTGFSTVSTVLTTSDFDNLLGENNIRTLIPDDHAIADGTHYLWGNANAFVNNSLMNTYLWIATGSSWSTLSPKRIIASKHDVGASLVTGSTVAKANGGLVYCYTAGANKDVIGERQVYAGAGTLEHIAMTDTVAIPHGSSGDPDERRAYGSQWLKSQTQDAQGDYYLRPERHDGAYQLWFSQHDLGSTGNEGISAIADLDRVPFIYTNMGGRQEGGYADGIISSNYTIGASGSYEKLPIDSLEQFSLGESIRLDETANEFVVEEAGEYNIVADALFDVASDQVNAKLAVIVNGDIVSQRQDYSSGANFVNPGPVVIDGYPLEPGNTISLQVRSENSTPTIISSSANTSLQISK